MPMKSAPVKDATNLSNIFESNTCNDILTSKFIIHDGPPFANGHPHVGHALNKILKDIILRYKHSRGYKVSYTPGWDCHGLPIELKSEINYPSSVTELRENASNIATKYIGIQKKAFKSWGVIGDWDNHYATYNNTYQSKELKAFNILCNKKLVFRNSLPTYWSCSSKTALAEAELEYNHEHKSETIFVKFHLLKEGLSLSDSENVSLLIWTTTPWTLVSNESVGVASDMKYLLCSVGDSNDKIVIGNFVLERLRQVSGKRIDVLSEMTGKQLIGCSYRHPIFHEKICTVLEAPFVTETKGTGLVHVAPAHGKEDFELMKHLGQYDTVYVDNEGNFTDKCGDALIGHSVFNSGLDKIIFLLGRDVFHQEQLIHSYPYDWRTKKPIIVKLSSQWFIDVKKLSNDAMRVYKDINVIPPSMKDTMHPFIESRPYWCISRQRKWGVPMPILYSIDDQPIINNDFIDHISRRVDKEGSDFWWQETVEETVPQEMLEKWGIESSSLTKSTDIFDVWFDSGLSWWCSSLNGSVSDIYLEGIDQFRGWFSSSLLMSVALTGRSPFKSIVTHGFTVDGDNRKMSKSIGNVIDPADVINKFGVDVLRYWACASGCGSKNIISDLILKRIECQCSLLRNLFRFITGNISKACLPPLTYIKDPFVFKSLQPQDRYFMHLVAQDFIGRIMDRYNNYQFEAITPLIEELISKISNQYFTLIKDRLYCDSPSSDSYKSCVTTLALMLHCVVPVCAPIVPCLCHEVNSASLAANITTDGELFTWPHFIDQYQDNDLACIVNDIVFPLRHSLFTLDLSSHNIVITNQNNPTSELKVEIIVKYRTDLVNLQSLNNESADWQSHSPLCEILRCAMVRITDGSQGDQQEGSIAFNDGRYSFVVTKQSEINRCPRCRRFIKLDVREECCQRCSDVINESPVLPADVDSATVIRE